jgi:hypothetical protein
MPVVVALAKGDKPSHACVGGARSVCSCANIAGARDQADLVRILAGEFLDYFAGSISGAILANHQLEGEVRSLRQDATNRSLDVGCMIIGYHFDAY